MKKFEGKNLPKNTEITKEQLNLRLEYIMTLADLKERGIDIDPYLKGVLLQTNIDLGVVVLEG
ncbi:hypothetical protein ACTNEO_20195 [Gracilibacillus sp. HCP3S3_G5_1]|uniref:hypothetical protein n=1 Tax=unclassified Gracilibacillus TaxID=2625209 RepID=UPI003F8929EE